MGNKIIKGNIPGFAWKNLKSKQLYGMKYNELSYPRRKKINQLYDEAQILWDSSKTGK